MKKVIFALASLLMLSLVSCKKGEMSNNFDDVTFSTLNYCIHNDLADYESKLKDAGWVLKYNGALDGIVVYVRNNEKETLSINSYIGESASYQVKGEDAIKGLIDQIKNMEKTAPSKMIVEGEVQDLDLHEYSDLMSTSAIIDIINSIGLDKVYTVEVELLTKAFVVYGVEYDRHSGDDATLIITIGKF